MKDFEPAISNWLHYYKERKSRGEVTGYRFFRERLKDLEKAIKEGRLVCGHIRPCNKDPEEGLGPEVLELVGWLSEFAGKKVRITVEVLNDR